MIAEMCDIHFTVSPNLLSPLVFHCYKLNHSCCWMLAVVIFPFHQSLETNGMDFLSHNSSTLRNLISYSVCSTPIPRCRGWAQFHTSAPSSLLLSWPTLECLSCRSQGTCSPLVLPGRRVSIPPRICSGQKKQFCR